jgi:hypothetical protein
MRKQLKMPMDKILRDYVERIFEEVRLGRGSVLVDRNGAFFEILAELENGGDAMRYLNSKGQIAWKATPRLHDYLLDLQLDAEAEFHAEDV